MPNFDGVEPSGTRLQQFKVGPLVFVQPWDTCRQYTRRLSDKRLTTRSLQDILRAPCTWYQCHVGFEISNGSFDRMGGHHGRALYVLVVKDGTAFDQKKTAIYSLWTLWIIESELGRERLLLKVGPLELILQTIRLVPQEYQNVLLWVCYRNIYGCVAPAF